MKNESKIIGLLSESLKRQDRQAEETKSMRSEMNDNFSRLINAVGDLADVGRENSKRTERVEEHEIRIAQLEKHTSIK